MFGLQMPSLIQKLLGFGMDANQANIIGDTLGNCEAALEHNGPVELNGPVKLSGDLTSDGEATFGNVINGTILNTISLNGEPATYYTNITNITGGPPPAAMTLLVEATLAGDLNSGGTVVIAGKTFNGKFIPSGFKLTGGTLVGALPNGTDYSIVVANRCPEQQ